MYFFFFFAHNLKVFLLKLILINSVVFGQSTFVGIASEAQ